MESVDKSPTHVEFEMKSLKSSVEATLHYELDGPTRRKWAEIRNTGKTDLLLLDVQLRRFVSMHA